MSETGKRTIERLKKFSEAVESGAKLKECANCGPVLPGQNLVLVGLGLYCKDCAPKERAKRKLRG